MIELLRSEWLRARSRRIVAVLVIGGVLGIVVGMGVGAIQSNPPPPDDLRQAEIAYRETLDVCLSSGGQHCRENVVLVDFLASDTLTLDRFVGVLQGTASLLGLMTAVLGASLFGADWSSGTMGTLLTWESRRGRILVARATVVAALVLGLAVGLSVLFATVWWIATAMRGSTLGSEGWLGEVAEAVVRIGVMGAVFALVAGGFAMIGRSTTSGTIGLLLAVVLIDWLARGFWPQAASVGLIQNAVVFVSGADSRIFDSAGNEVARVTSGSASVALTIWAAAILGAGAASFLRRDVT